MIKHDFKIFLIYSQLGSGLIKIYFQIIILFKSIMIEMQNVSQKYSKQKQELAFNQIYLKEKPQSLVFLKPVGQMSNPKPEKIFLWIKPQDETALEKIEAHSLIKISKQDTIADFIDQLAYNLQGNFCVEYIIIFSDLDLLSQIASISCFKNITHVIFTYKDKTLQKLEIDEILAILKQSLLSSVQLCSQKDLKELCTHFNDKAIFPNFAFIGTHGQYINNKRSNIQAMIKQETNRQQIVKQFAQLAKKYVENQSQVQEFLQQYQKSNYSFSPEKSIQLYTKNTFLFGFVNNLLRKSNNPLEVFYIQPYVSDLQNAIKSLFKTQINSQMNLMEGNMFCYRGAKLSSIQQEYFQKNEKMFIESLGFLSTSKNIKCTLKFNPNTLITIQILNDLSPQQESGFADIAKYSWIWQEQEVLFNIKSIFYVQSACMKQNFFQVKLIYGKASQVVVKSAKKQKLSEAEQQFCERINYNLLFETFKIQGSALIHQQQFSSIGIKYWEAVNQLNLKRSTQKMNRYQKFQSNLLTFKCFNNIALGYQKNLDILEVIQKRLIMQNLFQKYNKHVIAFLDWSKDEDAGNQYFQIFIQNKLELAKAYASITSKENTNKLCKYLLDAVVSKNTHSIGLLIKIGDIKVKIGQFEQAKQLYKQAIRQIDIYFHEPSHVKKICQYRLAALQGADNIQKYRSSIKIYHEVIHNLFGQAQKLRYLIQMHLNNCQYEQSLEACNKLIDTLKYEHMNSNPYFYIEAYLFKIIILNLSDGEKNVQKIKGVVGKFFTIYEHIKNQLCQQDNLKVLVGICGFHMYMPNQKAVRFINHTQNLLSNKKRPTYLNYYCRLQAIKIQILFEQKRNQQALRHYEQLDKVWKSKRQQPDIMLMITVGSEYVEKGQIESATQIFIEIEDMNVDFKKFRIFELWLDFAYVLGHNFIIYGMLTQFIRLHTAIQKNYKEYCNKKQTKTEFLEKFKVNLDMFQKILQQFKKLSIQQLHTKIFERAQKAVEKKKLARRVDPYQKYFLEFGTLLDLKLKQQFQKKSQSAANLIIEPFLRDSMKPCSSGIPYELQLQQTVIMMEHQFPQMFRQNILNLAAFKYIFEQMFAKNYINALIAAQQNIECSIRICKRVFPQYQCLVLGVYYLVLTGICLRMFNL